MLLVFSVLTYATDSKLVTNKDINVSFVTKNVNAAVRHPCVFQALPTGSAIVLRKRTLAAATIMPFVNLN
jgi:hypothetical protein